jgi:anthranilate synthase/aminodeoxychorismate synthase-like glutamine amidotransferase
MLAVIDNYDSFTYNLVQALGELGAEMKIFRNDALTVDELDKIAPDRILLSPGPCTPNEAGISLEVVTRFAGKVPILGVCLGHQAIAQAFGGDVVRAPRLMHGKTSEITHDNLGVLKGMPCPFVATRYHSLTVREDTLPDCLMPTSHTVDQQELMGIRHREFAIEGVQYHPESFLTPEGCLLLKNFLEI